MTTSSSDIVASIQQLLEFCPDFKELLLLISLINSQSIPKDLLETCQPKTIVDTFLTEMIAASLMVTDAKIANTSVFSLDNTTQRILIDHLTQNLQPAFLNSIVTKLGQHINDYATQLIDQEDFKGMTRILPHLEVLITKEHMLSERMGALLKGRIGCIQYYTRSDDEVAKENLQKSLKDLKKYDSQNHQEIAKILLYTGNIHWEIGDYSLAKSFYEQSLTLYQTHHPELIADVAHVQARIGMIHRYLHCSEKAKNWLETSLITYHSAHITNTMNFAWALAQLALIYQDADQYLVAKDLLQQSLQTYQQFFPDNQLRIAWTMIHLGNTCRILAKYTIARELLETSLTLHQDMYGADHIDYAWALLYVGHLYEDLRWYTQAIEAYETSLKIRQHYYEDDHPKVLVAQHRLATLRTKLVALKNRRTL